MNKPDDKLDARIVLGIFQAWLNKLENMPLIPFNKKRNMVLAAVDEMCELGIQWCNRLYDADPDESSQVDKPRKP